MRNAIRILAILAAIIATCGTVVGCREVTLLPPTVPAGEIIAPMGATHLNLGDFQEYNTGSSAVQISSINLPNLGTRTVADFEAFAMFIDGKRKALGTPDLTTNSVTFRFEFPIYLAPDEMVTFNPRGNLKYDIAEDEAIAGGPHHMFQATMSGITTVEASKKVGNPVEGTLIGILFNQHVPTLRIEKGIVGIPPYGGENHAWTGEFVPFAEDGNINLITVALSGQSGGPNLEIMDGVGDTTIFSCEHSTYFMHCDSTNHGMMLIQEGNGIILRMFNDIFENYGGEEIKFWVESEFDVYAIDDAHPYDYGVNVEYAEFAGNPCEFQGDACNYSVIIEDQVRVRKSDMELSPVAGFHNQLVGGISVEACGTNMHHQDLNLLITDQSIVEVIYLRDGLTGQVLDTDIPRDGQVHFEPDMAIDAQVVKEYLLYADIADDAEGKELRLYMPDQSYMNVWDQNENWVHPEIIGYGGVNCTWFEGECSWSVIQ